MSNNEWERHSMERKLTLWHCCGLVPDECVMLFLVTPGPAKPVCLVRVMARPRCHLRNACPALV